MSIWDTDKTNTNRLKPQINAKDGVTNRMAHGTIGFTLKQEDSDTSLGKLVLKDGRLQLLKDDNTYVDLSNGNVEVKKVSGDTVARLGYRPTDSDGAVDVAKPGTAL